MFQPNEGDILKARVNKVGGDHIGCLVHDCFNASVPACVDEWDFLPKMGKEFLLRVKNVTYRNEVITINGDVYDRYEPFCSYVSCCICKLSIAEMDIQGPSKDLG